MAVTRFRRKPVTSREADQVAARYTPGQPLDDLRVVAGMADKGAVLAEIAFHGGKLLLVAYMQQQDDHLPEPACEVVEPGHWLAYSNNSDMLYDTDDSDWRQFYDEVAGA